MDLLFLFYKTVFELPKNAIKMFKFCTLLNFIDYFMYKMYKGSYCNYFQKRLIYLLSLLSEKFDIFVSFEKCKLKKAIYLIFFGIFCFFSLFEKLVLC